jgi:hypothetical protein
MPDASESTKQTRVYATGYGRAVIEGLRACYDNCAAWKQPAPEPAGATDSVIER